PHANRGVVSALDPFGGIGSDEVFGPGLGLLPDHEAAAIMAPEFRAPVRDLDAAPPYRWHHQGPDVPEFVGLERRVARRDEGGLGSPRVLPVKRQDVTVAAGRDGPPHPRDLGSVRVKILHHLALIVIERGIWGFERVAPARGIVKPGKKNREKLVFAALASSQYW